MSAHALLSPSGASRWLVCTPAARLESQFEDKAGEAAKEGTLAHSLGELLLKQALDRIDAAAFNKELQKIKSDERYDNAMLGHMEEYMTFVIERYAEAQSHTKDALIALEQKLDLTEYVPEGFGTGDVVIIADTTLILIDLKYGKGVPVSATDNKQMMLYGLGALHQFELLYNITTVSMTIYQPRIDNFSTWEISVDDLKNWAETELKPKAKQAFEGQGDFVPGKHCQFCRAKAMCRANADYQLELAKYEFQEALLLDDTEVADILTRVSSFQNWLKSVTEFALKQAVEGKKWPGFKVVEGRANRKYVNEAEVVAVLTENGYQEDKLFTKKILGITEMTGFLKKKTFDLLLTPLLIKPRGKPALVTETDPRAEYSGLESAKIDFEEDFEDD